jgi:hypothetical protein
MLGLSPTSLLYIWKNLILHIQIKKVYVCIFALNIPIPDILLYVKNKGASIAYIHIKFCIYLKKNI